MEAQLLYSTLKVDGLSIFYGEAGPKDAPTILLLHGLPSSSRMFQPLLTRLADKYHLVAPEYPGYGHSDWPDPQLASKLGFPSGFRCCPSGTNVLFIAFPEINGTRVSVTCCKPGTAESLSFILCKSELLAVPG
jgi:pimeloyl-ACP methyl ester carboxylesterase